MSRTKDKEPGGVLLGHVSSFISFIFLCFPCYLSPPSLAATTIRLRYTLRPHILILVPTHICSSLFYASAALSLSLLPTARPSIQEKLAPTLSSLRQPLEPSLDLRPSSQGMSACKSLDSHVPRQMSTQCRRRLLRNHTT